MFQELQINMNTSFNLFFWTHLHYTSDENALVILDELYKNYTKFCSDHQLPLASKSSMGKSLCRLGFKDRKRIQGSHGKGKISACLGLAWAASDVNPNYHLLTHNMPKRKLTSRTSEWKHKPKWESRTPETERCIPKPTPSIAEWGTIIPKQEPRTPPKKIPKPNLKIPEWKPIIKKQARKSPKWESTSEPKQNTSKQVCVPKRHTKPIKLKKTTTLAAKSRSSKQNQCKNKFKLKMKFRKPKTPRQTLQENAYRRQLQVNLGQSSKRYIFCPFTSKNEAATIVSSLGLSITAHVLPEEGAFFVRE
ncbi:uncharacterized protein [Procambarus clarkii]|uniref:uncharacterized protein n=1 Tax=Procambarus clarkii TaxID=6728 RepID=UPI003743AA48